MPSLNSLTGRPSPTAWPDPTAVAVQPKSCNVRRSQWPFLVQGEEIITDRQPSAKVGKLVADVLMAADVARRTYDAKSPDRTDTRRIIEGEPPNITLSAARITASGVEKLFVGPLEANPLMAAWAMRNGQGHLVKKP